MDPRNERLYDPGQAPVYPLPERQPWETFERWGMPPERPARPPLDSEAAYVSPGPPPGFADPPGVPRWTLAIIAAGVILVVVAGTLLARIS